MCGRVETPLTAKELRRPSPELFSCHLLALRLDGCQLRSEEKPAPNGVQGPLQSAPRPLFCRIPVSNSAKPVPLPRPNLSAPTSFRPGGLTAGLSPSLDSSFISSFICSFVCSFMVDVLCEAVCSVQCWADRALWAFSPTGNANTIQIFAKTFTSATRRLEGC